MAFLLWSGLGALVGGGLNRLVNVWLPRAPRQRRHGGLHIAAILLFAYLPWRFGTLGDRVIGAGFLAILLGIMVLDIECRLIPNVVVGPALGLALLAPLWISPAENTLLAALLGALLGFLFFGGLYWLGRRLFGPGALGAGDVKLAMLLGAMLGLHRVLWALALGMLLAGLWAVVLLWQQQRQQPSASPPTVPLGAGLSLAGILMLLA